LRQVRTWLIDLNQALMNVELGPNRAGGHRAGGVKLAE
jgi:hypothetical protein